MADPWAQFRAVPTQAVAGGAEADPWGQFRAEGAVPKAGQSIPASETPLEATGRLGRGFVRGVRDPVDAGAQLLTHGLSSVAPEGSWFDRYMQGQVKLVDDMNKAAEEDYQKNWRGGAQGADVGRIAGNVAATAPIAMAMPGAAAEGIIPRIASGMASGGITGGLEPVDPTKGDFWSQKGPQVLAGMAGGAVAPIPAGGAARIIAPNTAPEVKSLISQGVKTTPGQTLGGAANRIEEGLQSIPFVGDVIKGARTRAVESFDTAAVNRALEPIGEKLSTGTMGRDAIAEAKDKISGAYEKLVPTLKVAADPQFANNVSNLVANSSHLEPGLDKTFQTILRNKVFDKFSANGRMTGESFKEVEGELGRIANDYSTSVVASERQLGGALKQMQAEMRDLLLRSNPDKATELKAVNAAYANFLRVEGAAGKIGSEQGVFTPAQLANSVRGMDPSMRKGQYARGEALMQDLSDAGKTVLGNKVPDSGTPFRHFVGIPALMGIGGAGGYATGGSPESAGVGAALGGAAMASAYTRPGAALLRALLAKRPAVAAPIASVVRNNPVTSPLAAILAQQSGGP